MKKTLIGLALISMSGASVAAEHYSGRLSSMAGSGFATGHYSDGVLLNPSLGANFDANDRFALVINAGLLGTEKHKFLDNAEDLRDLIDEIDAQSGNLSQAQADRLVHLLERVDSGHVRGQPSANLTLSFPNEVLPVTLFYKTSGSVNAVSYVSDSDLTLIQNAVNQPFDSELITSSV